MEALIDDGGGGEAGEYSFVACLWSFEPLTTHPFRDGAPFPHLIETPPISGRSERFFHILREENDYLISFLFARSWPPSVF